ncbi:MAG: GNAT family N-acetyltransferase [Deltaproteobacteria bacterium]|nr:GNAT family N-acetyltransferase [Deltaproteobacteria bacterium]
MAKRYRIRPYLEGDEVQILRLRNKVFGDLDPVRRLPDVWKWQFRENPAGPGFCSLAEDDDGFIVGQYAAIPSRFSIDGKQARLAFAVDAMTHPRYRRQGLFTALAQDLYHRLETEHNISTVWGFPNQRALSGYTKRLGWRTLPSIPVMIMPLRPLAAIFHVLQWLGGHSKTPSNTSRNVSNHNFIKLASDDGLHMEPIHRFHGEYDELWQTHFFPASSKSGQSCPIIQIRDSRYLQWRYLAASQFHYHPFAIRYKEKRIGYLVLRMMSLRNQSFGVLADLFPFPIAPDALMRRILSFAGKYVKDQGGDFLTCLSPPNGMQILKRSGFIRLPEIINPKTWYFGYRCKNRSNLNHWHITFGDTDIV